MGMMTAITVIASDEAAGRQACRLAFAEVERLNALFSDWDPDSELSRLCRSPARIPVPISPELMQVLTSALQWAEATQGAYDPTAAPVILAHRRARVRGELPLSTEVREVLERVGYRHVTCDPAVGTVTLGLPDMRIDLGAIAKGFIGDRVIALLAEKGFPAAAFEAGGDRVFGDAPPGRPGWEVLIPHADGVRHEFFARCAVSISGDTAQFLVVDGVTYSHVIDARTGRPLTGRRQAVVVAPAGILSDPLATIGTILPEVDFRVLLNEKAPPETHAEIFRIE